MPRRFRLWDMRCLGVRIFVATTNSAHHSGGATGIPSSAVRALARSCWVVSPSVSGAVQLSLIKALLPRKLSASQCALLGQYVGTLRHGFSGRGRLPPNQGRM
ncbi:hypothetical protein BGLA2_730047 [Burkholderia gladioli]|nr:hypothetical protein BGLA2_730047 [Burkholderia gladioli]